MVGLSVWDIHAISISHANAATGRSMRSFVPPWVAQANARGGMMRYIKDSPEGTLYSQDQEDKFAESHYFHNLHNGTFLEMGALDGTCSDSFCRRPSLGFYALLRHSSIFSYTL